MRTPSLRALVPGCAVFLLVMSTVRLSSDETTPEAYLHLADRLFVETKYRDAADAYRKARDQREATTPSLTRRAALGLARSLLRLTRFADARDEANRFVAAHPTDADALTLDAETLWGLGLFPEARARFNDALARNPQDPYAHHGLARVLAAERQFKAALAHANEAILRTPREIEPRFTRAFILERLHQFSEAASTLRETMDLFMVNEKSDRAILTRSQIRFLESFRNKVPFEIDPQAVDATHTVPFRLDRDKVIVKGRINGGQPIDLVLDTGAEMTVLGRRTAERAGVSAAGYTVSAGVGERGIRGLQVGRLDLLQVGTFRVRSVPVLIKNPPLLGFPRHEADSFSPLSLGVSMTIDYAKRQLTFGRTVRPRGEIELPLYSYRLSVVRGMINNRTPATFVVDTGGEVISISTATAEALNQNIARKIGLRVYGTSGWDRDAFLMPGVNLRFNNIAYDNFSVVVLNLQAPSVLLGFQVGGIVGHKFLSPYRVSLDLDRSELRMSKSTSN
jgi:Flp pilus assembly protein TadD/predicted aspartyl protease